MVQSESVVNPKPIISLMFSVSVGFWAKELASYATEEHTTLGVSGDGLTSTITLLSGTLFLWTDLMHGKLPADEHRGALPPAIRPSRF